MNENSKSRLSNVQQNSRAAEGCWWFHEREKQHFVVVGVFSNEKLLNILVICSTTKDC